MKHKIASDAQVRALRRSGWRVEDAPRGKLRWTSPDGAVVVSGRFCNDVRAAKNHAARLKRAARPSGVAIIDNQS